MTGTESCVPIYLGEPMRARYTARLLNLSLPKDLIGASRFSLTTAYSPNGVDTHEIEQSDVVNRMYHVESGSLITTVVDQDDEPVEAWRPCFSSL